MTDKIYEFYVLDPTGETVRKTDYTVSSPKGRHKMFRGTREDFLKVVDLYSDLWDAVMDSQLGLLGDEHAGVLTDDPILQNWEGAEIIAVEFDTKKEFWYLGDDILEPIPTDQGETFGVTESAVYYDEDGM